MSLFTYFKDKKLFKQQKLNIESWLESMKIKEYTINSDLTVDVDGDVNLSSKNLTHIPIQFGTVKNFFIINNKLTSLVGAPFEVNGYFYCQNNQLTNLNGSPQVVNGTFNCSHNRLTSLIGAPVEVSGIFDCSYNELTNLENGPQSVLSSYNCNNNKITTLKTNQFLSLGEGFNCANNQLTSLEGVPNMIEGSLDCSNNLIMSLEFLPQVVKEDFDLSYNPLNLKDVLTKKVMNSFSNYAKTKVARRFIFTCEDLSLPHHDYFEEMRQFASKDKFIVDSSSYDHFYVVLSSISKLMMNKPDSQASSIKKLEKIPDIDYVLYTNPAYQN